MIILYTIGLVALILISCIIGVAYGYSQGYEDCMLERMTKKQRTNYLANKAIMTSIAEKLSLIHI
jgi:hypothetical protein